MKLPGQAIIDGYKGKIDFYVWRTIPVARKWPRKPTYRRSPAELARQHIFGYASKIWNGMSLEIREAYAQTAGATNMTARDLATKAFIKSYFREGQFD